MPLAHDLHNPSGCQLRRTNHAVCEAGDGTCRVTCARSSAEKILLGRRLPVCAQRSTRRFLERGAAPGLAVDAAMAVAVDVDNVDVGVDICASSDPACHHLAIMPGKPAAPRSTPPPASLCTASPEDPGADDERSSESDHPATLSTAFDRLLATVVTPSVAPQSPVAARALDADLYTPPPGITLRGARSSSHVRGRAMSPLKGKRKSTRKGHIPFGNRLHADSPTPLNLPPHRGDSGAQLLATRSFPDDPHLRFPGLASDSQPGKYRPIAHAIHDPEIEGEMLADTGVGGTIFTPVPTEELPESLTLTYGAAARRRTLSEQSGYHKRHGWWYNLFRPPADTVELWLDSWFQRWTILVAVPSCLVRAADTLRIELTVSLQVWIWCAVPFPKTSPFDPNGPWCTGPSPPPWCNDIPQKYSPTPPARTLLALPPHTSLMLRLVEFGRLWLVESRVALMSVGAAAAEDGLAAPVDANFWFFLIFYYGLYCAVGLLWITQLFTLYRLNWWPKKLGAKVSYLFFWLASICTGYGLHELDLHRRPRVGDGDWDWEGDDVQWQRKTIWVGLAFATMAMPALACLIGLRRSGRQRYSTMVTDLQRTFLERQFNRRIPASYTRFLWFMLAIGLALGALVLGQAYASVFLSTLPHSGVEGTAYVVLWQITVTLLTLVSNWVLKQRVRSRALSFVFRYYFFLTYFIFYRNLFARLQSFNQFALLQLLSSFWVCIWYPLSMSGWAHRVVSFFDPHPESWEEYVETVGLSFYLRNLAQNTTMAAFLGWVSILHFGPNQALYPFFAFDDQYEYSKTMLGSSAIWASELASAFLARLLCKQVFAVDVTNLGLGDMRAYPELVPTCLWTSVHVLMDMLLFLLKLNFR